jgi:hypothetical protein
VTITNGTPYRSADLRAILSRVAADELADQPMKRKRLTVVLVRSRGTCSGVAWKRSCHVRIRVPGRNLDPVLFAWLAAHEFAHVRGMGHARMPTYLRHWITRSRELWAWAAAYPIRLADTPAVPSRSALALARARARRDHAWAMLQKADTRLKRATTIQRAWARKLRDAERRLADVLAAYCRGLAPDLRDLAPDLAAAGDGRSLDLDHDPAVFNRGTPDD